MHPMLKFFSLTLIFEVGYKYFKKTISRVFFFSKKNYIKKLGNFFQNIRKISRFYTFRNSRNFLILFVEKMTQKMLNKN
jgi:hypothetical protein